MGIYHENVLGIRKMTEIERNAALVEKMQAEMDYIAMMTDVELPDETDMEVEDAQSEI